MKRRIITTLLVVMLAFVAVSPALAKSCGPNKVETTTWNSKAGKWQTTCSDAPAVNNPNQLPPADAPADAPPLPDGSAPEAPDGSAPLAPLGSPTLGTGLDIDSLISADTQSVGGNTAPDLSSLDIDALLAAAAERDAVEYSAQPGKAKGWQKKDILPNNWYNLSETLEFVGENSEGVSGTWTITQTFTCNPADHCSPGEPTAMFVITEEVSGITPEEQTVEIANIVWPGKSGQTGNETPPFGLGNRSHDPGEYLGLPPEVWAFWETTSSKADLPYWQRWMGRRVNRNWSLSEPTLVSMVPGVSDYQDGLWYVFVTYITNPGDQRQVHSIDPVFVANEPETVALNE